MISKRQMYDLYKVWLEENHPSEVPCTWHYYDDIMKLEFRHLKLYKPLQDTCKTCNIYTIRSRDRTLTEKEKKTNEIRHAVHLAKADLAYKFPKQLIHDTNNTTMVLCMDLQ